MIITADRVANTIRMQRDQYSGAFLIVEGGVTDLRVYERFVDHTTCRLIAAHSKDNVINALDILEQENFTGVLAIVDADFWILEVKLPTSPNLFLTDTHDLETMILESPALEKLLTEYGSQNKIKTITERRNRSIREILVEGGTPVGYLRWISLQDNLSLKFEDLPFSRFVDDKTLAADEVKLIKAVKDHSQKHNLNEDDIQSKIAALKSSAHDLWHVCCGHDLICVLSVGLRKALGSHNAKDVEPEVIEKVLRLAYEKAYFLMTQLYQSIRAWEAINSPFKILSISA